jgi:hypothetical protein
MPKTEAYTPKIGDVVSVPHPCADLSALAIAAYTKDGWVWLSDIGGQQKPVMYVYSGVKYLFNIHEAFLNNEFIIEELGHSIIITKTA